ncbi:hypothetical protein U729_3122 (plasmid) [Clostridium baratii str. Sullivan]|uniref:Uncharacterized protein n=1 Tax=Clostridium baratii str. Sullivan TaxID=1415775 RepID=A0A0A7G319_9CLOT|nr:hypothetical protein [Clostridium baratii]AIY85376.1 hypothetical protein U729_3122 [Clostridium baratii str. Sullivan]
MDNIQRRKNKEEILTYLLLLDGNETSLISYETYEKFKVILIEVAKITQNIRYCSNPNCVCHPESKIKKILLDEKIRKFLNENRILEDIEEMVNNYTPQVSLKVYFK